MHYIPHGKLCFGREEKHPKQITGKNGQVDRSAFDIIDPTLPPGWRVKKRLRTGAKDSGKASDSTYLTPDGKTLRSRVAVVEYMKIMEIYSETQLEMAKGQNYRKTNEKLA